MTTFEMEPPDEPCPDCGSTHHRQCQQHDGSTINDVIKAVEKVQPKPITGSEWNRFLHPDEPEEDTGDEIAEEL